MVLSLVMASCEQKEEDPLLPFYIYMCILSSTIPSCPDIKICPVLYSPISSSSPVFSYHLLFCPITSAPILSSTPSCFLSPCSYYILAPILFVLSCLSIFCLLLKSAFSYCPLLLSHVFYRSFLPVLFPLLFSPLLSYSLLSSPLLKFQQQPTSFGSEDHLENCL